MDIRVCETMKFMQQFRFRKGRRGGAFIGQIGLMPIHMHDGTELLYVLKGKLEIQISFHRYQLKAGDFFLVNSYEAHSIKGRDAAEILFLQLDQDLFTGKKFTYDPHFFGSCKEKAVKEIKEHMVKIYLLSGVELQKQETEELMCKTAELCDRFLQTGWEEADAQLHQAELLLLGTEFPVQQVGRAAGFPTHACFVRYFKECFKMAPSAFRQKYRDQIYPKQERVCRKMVYSPDELTEIICMLDREKQKQYLAGLEEVLEQAAFLCELLPEGQTETERLCFRRTENRIEVRLKDKNASFAEAVKEA